ncbi:DNA-binding response OmpR family regulator [Catenibacillus scindens]|uniref:Stage 0 sporulation protein A homolog n=1 Tax=Catenibacillus scindens TaxID=673271 RepID=A0A7W8HA16_9FIRM|nr:response regulator transcription factor [Catenibacillus scindens]MBB5264659.1 DNA-binding response OmpR family regulator [Catenibacillus scindens]
MIKILIVEDELPISKLIEMNLTDAGYTCTCAYDGVTAADLIEKHTYDLILLDIMLPGLNGYELFEYIKPMNIPVIFITAKAALNDRVRGLHLGAEDYIVKPFEVLELLARVEVVLRRYNKSQRMLVYGDVTIDTFSMVVTKGGQKVNLTPKEFDLATLFVRNKNITLSRDRLFELVWGSDYDGDTRTLDLHVLRIRKKLGWENCLKTIHRIGYRLE